MTIPYPGLVRTFVSSFGATLIQVSSWLLVDDQVFNRHWDSF